MNYLGWLTKGACEITIADKLTGLAEFLLVIGICCGIWYFGFERRKK